MSRRAPEEWEWWADHLSPASSVPGLESAQPHRVDYVAVRDGGRRLRFLFTLSAKDAVHHLRVVEESWRVCVHLWVGSRPAVPESEPTGYVPLIHLGDGEGVACVEATLEQPLRERRIAVNDPLCADEDEGGHIAGRP